jgi:hypothetical protein
VKVKLRDSHRADNGFGWPRPEKGISPRLTLHFLAELNEQIKNNAIALG